MLVGYVLLKTVSYLKLANERTRHVFIGVTFGDTLWNTVNVVCCIQKYITATY